MLHELIDPDEPKCLYCNVAFDLNAMGLQSQSGSALLHIKPTMIPIIRADKETLFCVDCKETFEIHSYQKDDGETIYDGFAFTCKDLSIFNNYHEKSIAIRTNDTYYKLIAAIPEFPVNFSDREKLHEKLKTYILFS